MDKPLDLSSYLLLKTKEKMVVEAKVQDYELVLKNEKFHPKSKIDLLKALDEIKKELDEGFHALDRMLTVIREKEEQYDFPVAFVT